LDKNDFNKLLVGTAIKEFINRDIRKILTDNIYRHYKTDKISIENFIKLFKITEAPHKEVSPVQPNLNQHNIDKNIKIP
jgi:hypothetical protein